MVELIFSQMPDKNNNTEENMTIRFRINDSPHISTFHALCKRFALAVGYTDKTVEEYFGPTRYEY